METYVLATKNTQEQALNIEAVVFDYGQVISLPQNSDAINRIADRAGADREKFETTLWALRSEYDRGTWDSIEYYKNVLSSLNISMDNEGISELVEMDLMSWRGINEKTVELMKEIKIAGYRIGILSNMPHDFLAWARKSIPVFSLSDVSVFSCEENVIKPEEPIYRILLSRLGIKSGELVFFDDNAGNIKSALSLGIKAFLWISPEEARRELLSLGLKL